MSRPRTGETTGHFRGSSVTAFGCHAVQRVASSIAQKAGKLQAKPH